MRLSINQKTIFLIFIAFVFSFSLRLIWVFQFNQYEHFKFNNEFMINTNDGYYWAEGARDILSGKENINENSPINSATSQLTAFLVSILPFSFESIIFYMSGFFASLIVIPIILIGRSLGKLEVGFIAALIASIGWSYYNRTLVGYYDTDMLNIVFPTILLWSLIFALRTKEEKYLLISALDIIAYRWWYPQSYSLEFAFFGLIFLYVGYQYLKKQDYQYTLTLLIFILFAMMGLEDLVRLGIVLFLYLFLQYQKEIFHKYLYHFFAFSVVLFFVSGGFDPIWGQLKNYVFKEHIQAVGEDLVLHYYTVMQTIKEAGQIPFETFANRISGHLVTFFVGIVGYIWLLVRHPIMFLSLPLVGLGFLAYSGGLRFTIYAVPVLALGVAFFIVEIVDYFDKYSRKLFRYGLMSLLTFLALLPNIYHIIDYRVPPVFYSDEVKVLESLKTIASRDDYVVSWWDYGYPIRYYSDTKTLSDGGKHSGAVNFPTSLALTGSQQEAVNILRLDVEYTENSLATHKGKDTNRTNIAQMSLDFGFTNSNDFLETLQGKIELPLKTRDIYLYLPNRMLEIYPTISLFSNLDLMSGAKKIAPFFYITKKFQDNGQIVKLGNGVKLNKQNGLLEIGNKKVQINQFINTFYDDEEKLQIKSQKINPTSNFYVIYMENYQQFLVVDESVYNSTYFQLFVFENYDTNLFEPVILNPLAKVYKLKG